MLFTIMDKLSTLANNWFGELFRRKKVKHEVKKSKGLAKCLTTTHLISLGVGATLGAGTYVVTGQVAATIAGPSVTISFAIAAFTSILSGLCYAEFGSRVPQTTGSAYTYSYITVGEIWAFAIGWNLVLEYMIGTAADAAALSGSFDYAIGYRVRNLTITYIGTFNSEYLGDYPDFLSFLFTIVVTIILSLGVKESAQFTTLFNVFNVAVVLFIIITGLFFVRIENWTEGDGFFPYGGMGVISGAATCFYAFVGFDIIATTGEEATNAPKSIPKAIVASLLIVFVAYFGVSCVITLMMPYNELDKLSPIPDAFAKRGLPWANYIISIGAICGLSSSLLGNLFPLPRIILAMAQDGLLFKFFAKISPRTEVPVNATVYPGILTAFFGLLFDLHELVEMMSIGTLLAYTLVSLCVLILRYQPDEPHDTMIMGEEPDESKVELGEAEPHLEKVPLLSDDGDSADAISTDYLSDESIKQTENGKSSSSGIVSAEENLINNHNTNNKQDQACQRKGSDRADNETENLNTRINNLEMSFEYTVTQENTTTNDTQCSNSSGNLQTSSSEKLNKSKTPTSFTGRMVVCNCLLLFLWFFGFNAALIFGFDYILDKSIWAISLLILFGILSIVSIGIIVSMPQSKANFGFMAPCVPAMPILAIYLNVFLMLKLSAITWIRFGVWMAIGRFT